MYSAAVVVVVVIAMVWCWDDGDDDYNYYYNRKLFSLLWQCITAFVSLSPTHFEFFSLSHFTSIDIKFGLDQLHMISVMRQLLWRIDAT